jgi:hypothetical protein
MFSLRPSGRHNQFSTKPPTLQPNKQLKKFNLQRLPPKSMKSQVLKKLKRNYPRRLIVLRKSMGRMRSLACYKI